MCIYRYARACIPSASDRKRSRSDGRGTTGTQSTHKVLKDIRGEHQGTPAVLLGYSRGTPGVLRGYSRAPSCRSPTAAAAASAPGAPARASACSCLGVCVCACACVRFWVCVCV